MILNKTNFVMKYYSFDWDDNIVHMPTKIMLLDNQGNEVGMSTYDFGIYREMIGKVNFEYENKTIVGFAKDSFRFFRKENDHLFLENILLATPAPAFEDFKEAINNGSVFSIITARAHTPSTIREGIKLYIYSNFNGISKDKLIESLKQYRYIVNNNNLTDDELIDYYLDLCKYYPVNYFTYDKINTEDAKVIFFNEFYDFCKKIFKYFRKNINIKRKLLGIDKIPNHFMIGISDDDLKNNKTYKEKLNKSNINIYNTNNGIKELYN